MADESTWMQGRLTQTSAGMLLGCFEVLMEDTVTTAGKRTVACK